MTDRNVCMEAFERLCQEVNGDKNYAISINDYWLFELGFSSAIEELLQIVDSGKQEQAFVSPRFQMLAERILQTCH